MGVWVDFEAQLFKLLEAYPLTFLFFAFDENRVKEYIQMPRSDLFRVEKAERASRSIPGIGKQGFSIFRSFLVYLLEGLKGEVNFTSDFDLMGLADCERKTPDCLNIESHVIPSKCIAPGHSLRKVAFTILD
jgi:hypothetical protein